jgi:hypothetical protein
LPITNFKSLWRPLCFHLLNQSSSIGTVFKERNYLLRGETLAPGSMISLLAEN